MPHIELEEVRDEWLLTAARALFPYEADVRVPYLKDGRSMHAVFTDAHDALYNGRDWRDTQLQALWPEIVNGSKAIAVWWGDDWSALTALDDEDELLTELKRQLEGVVGDVYLRWHMKSR